LTIDLGILINRVGIRCVIKLPSIKVFLRRVSVKAILDFGFRTQA
jgi:hypothetical protein